MLTFKVVFSLLYNINQSACSTLDWVLNSQSEFDWVLYKHHWEFPIHKKIIPMLTCPIYNIIPLMYSSPDHSCYRIGFKYRVISVRSETDSFTVGWSSWYCWKCGQETQSTHSPYWGVQGKGMWYFQ